MDGFENFHSGKEFADIIKRHQAAYKYNENAYGKCTRATPFILGGLVVMIVAVIALVAVTQPTALAQVSIACMGAAGAFVYLHRAASREHRIAMHGATVCESALGKITFLERLDISEQEFRERCDTAVQEAQECVKPIPFLSQITDIKNSWGVGDSASNNGNQMTMRYGNALVKTAVIEDRALGTTLPDMGQASQDNGLDSENLPDLDD